MNPDIDGRPPAPWAGTLEERFRHEFLADVAAGPKDYEALVLFAAKRGEGVYSSTYVALTEGHEPYFIEPDVLQRSTRSLSRETLREFGEGRKGPLAMVTTYRASDGDLEVTYYTGAEAEHYTYGPTTVASLAKEISPL